MRAAANSMASGKPSADRHNYLQRSSRGIKIRLDGQRSLQEESDSGIVREFFDRQWGCCFGQRQGRDREFILP